jgi:hypothetical protein
VSVKPTVISSRAELVEYFATYPRRLVAARMSSPLKVGHPDFVGPIQPASIRRPGAIQFERDGSAFSELGSPGRSSCSGE